MLTRTSAVDPVDVMLTGWSFMRSKVLAAAIELDLFGVLEQGPATAEQVTERAKLHPRGVRDLLDMLTAMGILEREDGLYRNSPAASAYLVPDRPDFLGTFLTMLSGFMGPGWDSLADSIRTGKAHGQTDDGEVPFANVFTNPMALSFFLSGMDSVNGVIGPQLARALDWSRHATFADLGGARGNLSASLVTAHPHLTGAVLDQPPVEGFFHQHMEQLGTAGKVTFVPGSFFTDPLPPAEVYIIGNVLHDWSEDQRKFLIGKAAAALPAGGALVVYDPMIDEDRTDPDTLLLSLSMLLQSPAGSEYTPGECAGWMREAGLQVEGARPLAARVTAVIGRKG